MARYGSQEWKDNISLAKRLRAAERRRQVMSLDSYREQVDEERQLEAPFRIDFDTLVEDVIVVTRPLGPASSDGDGGR